jgi:hypothetical protein
MEMKSQRFLSLCVVVLVVACLVVPASLSAQSKPVAGNRAGSVSALLPVATIDRGTGKSKTTVEAKKGDEIIWNDLVKTAKGGRARITLTDQSVLSLGSQAELRIVKHDARTQQTALQLAYGRVRAEVASVTRDGGKFELRTPTAVAGVIGTDFGTDSSIPGVTTFLCIAGIVTVGNADAKIPGTVPCPAGSTTSVSTGLPPTPPKPATQQQIQQLIQDTEPAVISALSPSSALQGITVASTASGTKMAGINTVAITGSGVKVSIDAAATETGVGIKVEVAADAAPGSRTITFTKANGQSTAAVFTILEPPNAKGTVDIASLKKAYTDILDQERQSEIAGLNAIGLGVQQSAGDTLAIILAENKKLPEPLDQSKIEQNLGEDVSPLLKGLNTAGGKLNEDTANAAKEFNTAADAAYAKIIGRKNATPPDDEIRKAVKDAFDKINADLLAKFKAIHEGLGADAKGVNAKLGGTENRWLELIRTETAAQKTMPLPKSDADERSFDQGLMASFDAARSKGAGNSSIASYSWVLCDPSYKPQQVGIPLPASDNKCRPLPGYAATSSDFRFPTCQLAPQDYIARVTVTDDKQKSASMDVRLKVLKGDYEDPTTRLQSAAAAFQTLQSDRFMSFFDTSFANYGSLSETIRRTFEGLASMTINLRVSQASINCNEATVRADWQQNYTFKADQSCDNLPAGNTCQRVVFTQTEQLTSRMLRVADSSGTRILGWNIVDFQGDNGTVQGTPPGPRTVDTALPDLEIVALAPTTGPRAAREDSTVTTLGVAPGLNAFAATVGNRGTGPLSAPAKIRFTALGPNNVEVASDLQDVPIPLGVGQAVTIIGHMNIPDLGAGVPVRITATVNPGCVVPEKNCDGSNIQLLDVLIGVIDLKLSNVVAVGTLIGTQPGSVTVDVTNVGTRTSVATVGNLKVGSSTLGFISPGVSVPAIAPGATVTITVPFIVPNTSGSQNLTAALSPASTFDFNQTNDSVTAAVSIVAAKVDLQLSNLVYSAGTPLVPPFVSLQSHTVSFNVKNAGNVPSSASDFYACKLVGPSTQSFPALTLPSVAAGATLTGLTFTFLVPINFAGSDTLTCAVSQDTFEAAATIADNQASLATQVNSNIDLQLINVPVPNGPDQMGSNSSVTFGVQNIGTDTAAAGYNIVLTINGNIVSTVTGPAILGGAAAPITINYVNPQIGPAPQDVNVPATLQVNTNAVVVETNTANNTVSRTLRLLDFTLNTIPTGPLSAISGRSFNSTVVQVLPTTYPASGLGLNIFYPGAPTGLTNAGPNGTQLGSNSISGAPGSYTVTPTATVAGVTHTGAPITVQLLPDISMSLGTAFALSSNGSPQPFQVQVTGGVNPINLSLTLPAGITIASGPGTTTSVSAPGSVTWNLQADTTAAIGAALTNISVVATDAGIGANNVGAGNKTFTPTYSNGGFDNYVLTGATLTGTHSTGSGQDAFQVGETVGFDIGVTNVGNLGQTGNMVVQITCVPSCGLATATITAPAPGANATAHITLPVTVSAGSYTGTIGIVAASTPPQSSTADDTLSGFPFEVFDFTLANANNFAPVQNVPLNGSGQFVVNVTELGPAASTPVVLPFTATTTGSTGTNFPGTVSGGAATVTMFKNAGVVSGTPDTVTASVNSQGITKTTSQNIKFFTAAIVNTTSGGLGDSSGNHAVLAIGGSGVTLSFKITGDFDATTLGTLAVNTANGITFLVTGSTGAPNDTFNVQFTPTGSTVANGTETVLTLDFTVPNTYPVQHVIKQVFLFPVQAPDLSVSTSANPGGALSLVPAGISTGRNFNGTDPLISGEGAEFTVKVFNTGGGASSANLKVTVYLGTLIVNQTTIPSIPAGSSTSFLAHIRAPEPVGTACCGSILVSVDSDPLEFNTGNNFQGFPIATSDWQLDLVGGAGPSGASGSPLTMASNTVGSTTVRATTLLSGGLISTPITVVLSGVSTGISATAPVSALSPPTAGFPPQGSVGITTGVSIPAGEYAVQLEGHVADGGVTSKRGTTVHINVNGGVPVTAVSVSSSAGNAQAGNPSTCSGGCTVRQINGALSDTMDITATGGSGTVDLIFTDDNAIVSNVSVPSGTPGPQYLNAVPYNSPRTISFAPLDTAGNVTAGAANVVVSAVAATTAARGGPIQEKVGTQQTTLYFNIGDLTVSPNFLCGIQVAPGGTTHVDFNFVPNHGFDQSSLLYNWTSFAGAFVTLAQSNSGTSTFSGSSYSIAGFDFTNHETANLGFVNFNLDVTIQGANGSQATKHFTIPVYLSAGGCNPGAASREGSTASTVSFGSSYWTRGVGGSTTTSSIRRERTNTISSALPDLQIKPVDVSISPSVPKSGDTVDVRFKVSNAGAGNAAKVPIVLQVNGASVASQNFDLAAGASTLGALQWVVKLPEIKIDRPQRYSREGRGDSQPAPTDKENSSGRFDAKLIVDPTNTVPEASTSYKAVQLSKLMLQGGAAVSALATPMDRVFLEVGTICVSFRMSSGSAGECETGADLDISIVDFASSRFELISQFGIADLGAITPATANANGAQFSSRVSLSVGHTYAVQLTGGKIGILFIERQLTPMQLAAEAKKRFGRSAIRIVSRLGGGTGPVGVGDVAGSAKIDALTYFELAFSTQQ